MRKVRYSVAASLDGFIAGPNGEIDWIVMDPETDFGAMMREYGTILVGRKTFETMAAAGRTTVPGLRTVVISASIDSVRHPEVTVLREVTSIAGLKTVPGKDIWLFGGTTLFGSMAAEGLVDSLEVRVMPVLLGGGVPLLPASAGRLRLSLREQHTYKSGIVSLRYDVQ